MKILIIILIILGGNENFTGNISEFNKVKREAEFAFNDEDYLKASEKYSYLLDSLKYNDDNARLNLAHSYYHMDEIEKAKNMYAGLSSSADNEVKSIANQQMGVFESRSKNLEKSLDYFKKSLLANPNNEEARYNYELVKKKLEEQKENQDQDKDQDKKDDKDQDKKDEEKQDQENKDQQDKQDKQDKDEQKEEENKKSEEEKKEEEEQEQENEQDQEDEKDPKDPKDQDKAENGEEKKQEEMKNQPKPGEPNFEEKEISKEMAEMILQAMRNKELQYLQQLKRKPQKPVDKDKPDW